MKNLILRGEKRGNALRSITTWLLCFVCNAAFPSLRLCRRPLSSYTSPYPCHATGMNHISVLLGREAHTQMHACCYTHMHACCTKHLKQSSFNTFVSLCCHLGSTLSIAKQKHFNFTFILAHFKYHKGEISASQMHRLASII